MKIFVTNLPSSVERKKHILKQLEGKGLDYEFVECVIGKNLTDSEIAEACDLARIRERNKDVEWLNKGMIGCTMTSKKIHQEIVNRNLDYALLLEDDVVLPDNFKEVLADCEKIIQQGDVILLFWLGFGKTRLDKNSKISLDNVNIFEPIDAISGGSCTIFTREAARKMLINNTPIYTSPDSWGDFLKEGCINRVLCAYPLAADTADFQSIMELGKFTSLRKMLNGVFPFSYILKHRRKKFKKSRLNVKIV